MPAMASNTRIHQGRRLRPMPATAAERARVGGTAAVLAMLMVKTREGPKGTTAKNETDLLVHQTLERQRTRLDASKFTLLNNHRGARDARHAPAAFFDSASSEKIRPTVAGALLGIERLGKRVAREPN